MKEYKFCYSCNDSTLHIDNLCIKCGSYARYRKLIKILKDEMV